MSKKSANLDDPIVEIELRIQKLQNDPKKVDALTEIEKLEGEKKILLKNIYTKLSPYDIIQISRHPLRPPVSDYISLMVDDFIELHGDRSFGDDKAIITGMGKFGNHRALIVGHQKGKTTKERITYNFGMPNPEGYRKALHKMKLAEKFHLPIVALIDTPGANPDIGAEERGQAHAIAINIAEMTRLKTPIICIVIGEGGSGGALGIGVGDKFSILEYAYCSVISPEGCAAILWKSKDNAEDAANALKLTANDLYELGIVDEVIPEPLGAAHRNPQEMANTLKNTIVRYLEELQDIPPDTLLENRFKKYRNMGRFQNGDGDTDKKPVDTIKAEESIL
ncbi:MAG: acetyl-CoA carboxylase carboxyltransferase subunit alpha [Candidatus Scalindua sp. AMX11]|nr:MAG: acetyl-CoA carboxylase carboxyltransferase subunit alpha [Candidatus Scalindua sp.]NOG85626.1 acetyl-CoA carboxylase carboxyltransferase subunit alpha [Planctomycetota bacterium]RZV82476.1 MAG: acetyl-CoA carboxylase carboxyltransferase subunit alpha [Candidatus Scalindua sp. SCAELEC01]TDE65598.1 MAG: acetyl-CoA carboxylase carboxyltransferase subunit alpha [Candidatus Scalindua sp. AMX11]GJQ59207.1 MAG: acetyl-coenzyme A carboxylase carboxyl transferase subunit alpha [Candidatus Scalin